MLNRQAHCVHVLHGIDEGREFVLPREALVQLPGAPPTRRGDPKSVLPAAVSMGETVDGEPAVCVRWEDGGESTVLLEDLKRRGGVPPDAP